MWKLKSREVKARISSSLERSNQALRPLPPALFLLCPCIQLLIVSESCGKGGKQPRTLGSLSSSTPLKDKISLLRETACANVSFLSMLDVYAGERVHERERVCGKAI